MKFEQQEQLRRPRADSAQGDQLLFGFVVVEHAEPWESRTFR